MSHPRTAENAPDGPLLVWVADVGLVWGKPIGWRMGRRVRAVGTLPAELKADGYNGDWTIPFWHPLPEPPKP